ncbi:toprim domain-containing protein [endosymbiont GvMRE of Glomus versiforme]|uniref:toprim domain-containing protein n=1 Tax=endosymbiont GvMRE of Glomus versiforme TaxID=2039283 RepID=UPI000EC15C93|nr:toprim domain-containing protein [endosymbiont GvMRE of Glomus versiforme]RHZ35699.1 DNA primase [endosymbiont GvMRE of Glomus versiforme]
MNYKDLLNANDILHLLTNKLNFIPKQKGRSIFFLCPFHADKNPSLSFEPHWKIFTCFSCGFKANNIFIFWAKYKNPNLINEEELKEFEIKKTLVEISKLGYFSKEELQIIEQKKEENKDRLSELFSLVKDVYQHNLFTRSGEKVLDYLQNKRQIDRKLIGKFFLGCSINNKQISNLLFLQKSDSFPPKDLLFTNLVSINNNNQACDFFLTQQLIIPLVDSEGKIVSFAARKIELASKSNDNGSSTDKSFSKYVYLPNYQQYHKSSLLYNYSIAKKTREEECYLVEGFFDIISLAKLGIENCVALLGTNLSEEQIKLLGKLKKRIILFLDGDKSGREATINISIKLLLREIECEIIKYKYEGDPDDICHQFDKEIVHNILQERDNPYLFILNYYFTSWKLKENPQRNSRFIREIVSLFQKFKINIRNFLIEKLSLLTKLDKKEIEPYFVNYKFLFPAFDVHSLLVTHCNEMIQEKENKIISLCAQQRDFWLLVNTIEYFFSDESNRENYRNIHNYYISSSYNKSFLNSMNSNFQPNEKNKTTLSLWKIISTFFQLINNIKKFIILNYEQQNE